MSSRSARIALIGAVTIALLGLPLVVGCSTSQTSTPSAPVVAPLNTNPEPTEDANVQQSPAEESESVHATSTP